MSNSPDVTISDADTPAYRKQRIAGLQRELDGALEQLASVATVLTDAGVPAMIDGQELSLAARVFWLAAGAYGLTVAGANLNEYPSSAQEPNDYGEKHRTS